MTISPVDGQGQSGFDLVEDVVVFVPRVPFAPPPPPDGEVVRFTVLNGVRMTYEEANRRLGPDFGWTVQEAEAEIEIDRETATPLSQVWMLASRWRVPRPEIVSAPPRFVRAPSVMRRRPHTRARRGRDRAIRRLRLRLAPSRSPGRARPADDDDLDDPEAAA